MGNQPTIYAFSDESQDLSQPLALARSQMNRSHLSIPDQQAAASLMELFDEKTHADTHAREDSYSYIDRSTPDDQTFGDKWDASTAKAQMSWYIAWMELSVGCIYSWGLCFFSNCFAFCCGTPKVLNNCGSFI